MAVSILVILNLPAPAAARLKLAIGSLFVPLFGLATSTQHAADRSADAVTSRAELIRQNTLLRRENQELRIRALQYEETAKENARLHQLVLWQQKAPWKLRLANIVLRDPANWWKTAQIDLGSRDGMRENLAVLTADGLVGRIASVSLTRSHMVLIGDSACSVSAQVENTAGDLGVIGSGGPFDGSLVEMTHLSGNAHIVPGQAVRTSGKGGIFPRGIPVGTVVDVRPVDYGVGIEARVKLAANLGALNEVWVVLP
jgi:rod shape-determining protein MreC